jgi:hypothetical protein
LANDDRGTNRDATTHRPTNEERGLPDAKAKSPPPAKTQPAPQPKLDFLYLHHSQDGFELERDRAWARLRFPGVTSKRITSWNDLVAKLAKKQIGTLILMTHGVPGGLLIDKWKGGADAGVFLKKAGANIDRIVFEGCMIMRSPVEAAQLAAGLNASSATGYTWWHYTGAEIFKASTKPVPKDVASIIELYVTDFAKFLIRTPGGDLNQPGTKEGIIAALEKQVPKKGVGSFKVYVEWYHPDKKGGRSPETSSPARADLIEKALDTKSDATAFSKLDHANLGAFIVKVNVKKVA